MALQTRASAVRDAVLCLGIATVLAVSACGGSTLLPRLGDSDASSSATSATTTGSTSSSTSGGSSSSSSSGGSSSSSSSGSGNPSSGLPSTLLDVDVSVSGVLSGTSLVMALNAQYQQGVVSSGDYVFGSGYPEGFNGLATGASYAVTIVSQPQGETCAVNAGSGVVGSTAPQVSITCTVSSKPAALFPRDYDAKTAATTAPSARAGAASWTDALGTVYVFGGVQGQTGARTTLDDFWRRPVGGGWQRVASTDPSPGARHGAATWLDAGGTLWLFGGERVSGADSNQLLGDLWAYEPAAARWVSMSTDGPSARKEASFWVGVDGDLYLFGGVVDEAAAAAPVAQIWRYRPASQTWSRD